MDEKIQNENELNTEPLTETPSETVGDGTENNPFIISSVEEFIAINDNLSAFYKLAEDIDFQGVENIPIGTSSQPFKGGFDGDGHSIKNFKLKTGSPYAGIFGCAESAKIKNLLIENGEIEQTAGPYTGMLAGMLRDCTVEGIGVKGGSVTGKSYVGGLAGTAKGSISNSFVTADVTSTTNDYYTGGLTGCADNATIKNCYVACRVSKGGRGFVYGYGYTTVENSYYDRNICKEARTDNYSTGKLTAALLRKGNYEGWDFEKVWEIEEGKSYPYLRGMKKPAETIDAGYITEGTGTEEDPYLIRKTKAMGYMLYEPTAFYKLAEDLDFQGVENTPIGTSSQPFKGGFDGDGHSIKNFKLKTGNSYAGIFGLAESAKIKDLLIENGEIEQTAGSYTGMLAGELRDCTVESIGVKGGSVTGKSYVGGLAGMVKGSISNSFVAADVTSTTNDYYAGGLTGCADNVIIKNCYAACRVSKGGSGLVCVYRYTTVENSYYDRNIYKDAPTDSYNTGKLTAALLRKGNYEGWDFEKVWEIEEGKSYPYLRGMKKPSGTIDAGYITEGTGTEEDPYLIRNTGAMGYMTYEHTAFYKLAEDIDFQGVENTPIGTSSQPFKGGFDGDGHSIKNFKLKTGSPYAGIFGCAESAKIKNLLIENGEIEQTAGSYTGMLAGELRDCIVESIGVKGGSVTGKSYVGGLAGMVKGSISNSFVTADVTSTTNNYYTGGLTGCADNVIIKNCYAACRVSRGGSSLVYGYRYTTVENSYYDRNICKEARTDSCSTGKLTAALLRKGNYEGWDFEKVWEIEEGKSYPYLRGMKKPTETIDAGYITEGTGTEEDPYLIRNTGAMGYMTYEPTAFYKLAEDIDFQGVENIPIGTSSQPFKGGFDGDGHSIKNFKLKTGNSYAGILGLAESAKIKNLLIENGEIEQTAGSYTGMLAGVLRGCTVENISVSGVSVTGIDKTGGLAGYVTGGSLTGCSVRGIVTGRSSVGGLAGETTGTISDCFAIGDVTSTTNDYNTGGLTGYAENAIIKNCYAACRVSRKGRGLVYIYRYTTVENSYYDRNICKEAETDSYSTGKLTAALLRKGNYEGWDFEKVWEIEEGKSYPYCDCQ